MNGQTKGVCMKAQGERQNIYIVAKATRLVCALALALACAMGLAACGGSSLFPSSAASSASGFTLADVPAYTGEPAVEVEGNVPAFTDADRSRSSFEEYGALDSLGRCSAAFALVGTETMPEGERGAIGNVKPTGWQYDKYSWVDQNYLYNRCHLIAWSLAGEDDNECNLITGTRSLNVEGMLPYEQQVLSYIESTGNHVLYRVTPLFEGDNLLASGVLMEAESVEDAGAGVRFCVWCYNVEPGVSIDYATGKSEADGTMTAADEGSSSSAAASSGDASTYHAANFPVPGDEYRAGSVAEATYVLNTNTGKFHSPACQSVSDMKEHNKFAFNGTRDQAVEFGYSPCGSCKP